MPADEVTRGTDLEESRVRSGPRHAGPRKPLFTRFHMPAGKAIASVAMPTAVLVGMGFTSSLALADNNGSAPSPSPSKTLTADEYKDCVTALGAKDGSSASPSPSPSASATKGAEKATGDAAKGAQHDSASSDSASSDSGSDGDGGAHGEGGEDAPAPPAAGTPQKPSQHPSAPASGAGGKGAPTPSASTPPSGGQTSEPAPSASPSAGGGLLDTLGGRLGDILTGGASGSAAGSKAQPSSAAPSASPSKSGSKDASPSGRRTTDASPGAGSAGAGASGRSGGSAGTGGADGAGGALKDTVGKAAGTVGGAVKNTAGAARKAAGDAAKTAGDATKTAEDAAGEATASPSPSASPSTDPEDCPKATDAEGGVDNKVPLADDPWYLNASSLLLKGADYKGVVEVRTADGTVKKVLKYVISGGTDIGDLHQEVQDKQAGKTYHVQASAGSTSTIRGGDTVMYTESISGNLLGLIPITFSPDNPPPLNIPLIYFTKVKAVQAGQFGGNLHVPGMHVYTTTG
ncbi:hypothetical protein [Streptomyces sp. NPDC046985]|uniref:hypothetical protein n=1 Tax=Streptomyces sp. NPDC046985 TaxID=3155377 RepID=UPI0033F9A2A5